MFASALAPNDTASLVISSISFLEYFAPPSIFIPLTIPPFNRVFLTILTVSTIFALSHLLNLLSGASIASTFLQVGYTFLMGGLFSTIMAKTKDIWLIVVIHTIFDIGGTLVNKLGSGIFQDKLFWIFTVVFGVLVGLYILFNIYVLNKKDNESLEPKKEEIQA